MKNTAYRHVNLLPWKETLLLKAKALNFIEVYCSLERKKNTEMITTRSLSLTFARKEFIKFRRKTIQQSQ